MSEEIQKKIDDYAALVTGFKDAVSVSLDGIKADIEKLKADHPSVDFSKLEASVNGLSDLKIKAESLDAENN